jgi:hypothetical protein
VAHGYRKRVQHVAGFRVQVFKPVAHCGEERQQRVGERMQAPGEAALVQPVLPPVLLHVVLGHDQVAAELSPSSAPAHRSDAGLELVVACQQGG